MKNPEKPEAGHSRLKLAGAAVLFVLGVVLIVAQYVSVQPPSLTENPGFIPPILADAQGRPVMPTAEERRAVLEQLNLTPEQRQQMEALDPGNQPPTPGAMRKRMEAAREILDEQQMATLQRLMGDRFEARMRERANLLPPDQREKYLTKLAGRRAEMEARVARGETPPFLPVAP